jgi:hypothetical protein
VRKETSRSAGAESQAGTPIGSLIRHAWVEEARKGREIFQNQEIKKEIGWEDPLLSSKQRRVLIIDEKNKEKVKGFYVSPDIDYYFGFTKEHPGYVYALEDWEKWKPRLTPWNAWCFIRDFFQDHVGFYLGFYGSSLDMRPEYKVRGERRKLSSADAMEKMKGEIERLKEYVERESRSAGLPESVGLAARQLNRLKLMAFGYANAALKGIDGYSEREETQKILDAYAMAGLLDTRNVQRKLGKYGKGLKC